MFAFTFRERSLEALKQGIGVTILGDILKMLFRDIGEGAMGDLARRKFGTDEFRWRLLGE